MPPNPNLRIEPSTEADMARCGEIMSASFASEAIGPLIFGPHTPAAWAKTGRAHWHAVQEHNAKFPSVPFAIKCVHTDPETGKETIVGTAEWAVYDRERTAEEWTVDPYPNRLEYIEDEADRKQAEAIMQPFIQLRQNLVKGRKYGLLIFMAVDPEWRRQGAATACVRWGMDKCQEIGVPTYLEATEEGKKAYESMGWELLDVEGMEYPPMMWWPEGVERWQL